MVASDEGMSPRVSLRDGGDGQDKSEVTKECEGNLARFGGEHAGVGREVERL